MRFWSSLLLGASLLTGTRATTDGLTDLVSWDPHSLTVKGNRLFVFSGEFAYPRLPVPELWLDIFQKMRANGFNAASIYLFWNYHSPINGTFDFETGAHNLQRLFDYAQEAGIYLIARPGPYDNAEINGGGLALYLSDGSGGSLRTSDATYTAAWEPWVEEIGKIIAANSITKGGPVILNQIENELQETTHSASNTLVQYMIKLEAAFRAAGVDVPFTHNEKGMRSESWSTDYEDVGGAVNVYGLDSYPGGLSCTNEATGFNVVRTYYQWFQNYSYTQPEYFPEFEGGWFSAWGASSFYDTCTSELSPNFADVYYKNNIGQKVTLQSIYMTYGGTNWGHLAAPVVYTSYDYSAPLSESRVVRDKMSQTKLIGLYTRVSTGLLTADMEGNGTGYTSSTSAYTWVLRDSQSDAGFYVVQQATTSSRTSLTFDLDVTTSAGNFTLTDINLDGRQSKIISTDYPLGHSTILYASTDIATYGTFGDTDVVVLYSRVGQKASFAFKNPGRLNFTEYGPSVNLTRSSGNSTTPSYTYTQASGTSIVQFSNKTIFYLLDTDTAFRFWAPPTTNDPYVTADQHIFVLGPYLVRNASVAGSVVNLVGDIDNTTTIEVFAGSSVNTVKWNGKRLSTTQTAYGSLVGSISGPSSTISLPALSGWKVRNSLPELESDYDDSNWTVCNKTTTLSPVQPSTLPVLYASDYGYYTGIKIYRGRFDGANATGASLTAQGGVGFGWNVWLNGNLVATLPGDASATSSSATLDFSNHTLKATDNLLTVVIDYTGHDETSTAEGVENPRGLLSASLTGGNFTSWKIQGNAGGAAGAYELDPVRAPMNEGGLLAERQGWHLPGYKASSSDGWTSGSPLDGLNKSGVAFYLTTFTLDLPKSYDVPLGIRFTSPATVNPVRIQLFINGYQYGKYVPYLGPQTTFPVPPGIINNRSKNTIGISLWAQTDAGAALEDIELVTYGTYESGFDAGSGTSFDMNGANLGYQPEWTEARLKYT
ncbi:glycoside hydrolase family 35 protein [Aspergillus saccharolyticus JOP 1030-1]|uniref:beta-galactosidase n=1 Tax=Aspergillus saccharolyticus JOP 1030-1 TaxID=1450539 RepID=A0A318Z7Z2_9EURO|nr:beta-galactosidase B [Aspergillus saccharolyticus JOP 1030-1]PYH42544.1 beta-galactosidase B [Aspergillus saccharolyticus JOP 1030-1]